MLTPGAPWRPGEVARIWRQVGVFGDLQLSEIHWLTADGRIEVRPAEENAR